MLPWNQFKAFRQIILTLALALAVTSTVTKPPDHPTHPIEHPVHPVTPNVNWGS